MAQRRALTHRLVEQYVVSFVSTGDVLRKEIMAKSEVGRKAEAVVARGGQSRRVDRVGRADTRACI